MLKRLTALAVMLLGLLLTPNTAHAYAWSVNHGYTTCATCHADPGGGGLLTDYGRAQGEVFIRTPWAERGADWEPGNAAQFAFGAVELPKWLLTGAVVRGGPARLSTPDTAPSVFPIVMQADLRAQVTVGRVRAYGSLGALPTGAAEEARVLRNDTVNLYSREHWLGVDVSGDLILRAGRMALPFGNRILEHSAWARTSTRTDINADQQHGVNAHYGKGDWRAEVMGIAGNLQLSPAGYRERGYSGLVEYSIGPKLVVGASSLLTVAELDIQTLEPRTLQAHGLQVRSSPVQGLAILGEGHLLVDASDGSAPNLGSTGWVQADYEIVQGVHVAAAGEWLQQDVGTSLGGWGSATWFFAPKTDLRVDYIHRQNASLSGRTPSHMVLGQLHFSL